MADEDEWNKLSTIDKVSHKSWKARAEGFKECLKEFPRLDEDDSQFKQYLGHIKKFVTDSNELNRIQGVQAAIAYIQYSKVAGKTCSDVIGGVLSKCFNAKPRLRELGISVCLMFVEIDKNQLTQEEVMKGFENKQPKIVHACLDVITIALREFGSKVITVKPLFKPVIKLLDHRDKNVREAAKALFVEMYRWIGAAVRGPLQAINATVLKELDVEWTKLGEGRNAQQTRFMRSQQDLKEASEATSQTGGPTSEENQIEAAPEIDPFDLIDPVEILSKLPKDFYEKIEAKKWQERKEVLEVVLKLSQNPKLVEGDYSDLVKALKKVVSKDSNILLVTIAIKCLGGLAAGLRTKFRPFAILCLEAMFDRFKEKKMVVLTALQEATDAVFVSTNVQLISESCVEYLANKNPSIRAQVGLFLARSFGETKSAVFKKPLMKMYIQALLKNVDHSDPAVREASYKAIGMMMKLLGEAKMNPFIADLDKLKLEKINESAGKCEVAASKPVPQKTTVPTPPTAGDAKPKAASSKGKLVPKKGVQKKEAAKKSSGPPPVSMETEMNEDVAEEKVAMVISKEERAQITNSNWKERFAGLQATFQHIKVLEPSELPCQAFVKVLMLKPGWKDTNFNCMNEKFKIIEYLAQNGTFSQTSANLCLVPTLLKIGDIKCGGHAKNALSGISDSCGLPWVATQVLENALSQKNPKIQSESLVWLNNSLREFGIAGLNLKFVIEKIKLALAASNPAVRTSALSVIGTLSLFLRDKIHVLFDSESPAMLKQIQAEIEKVKSESPPAPSRGAKKSSVDAAGSDKEEEEEVDMEDLVTRTDISGKVDETLLAAINNKNWKERKQGLEDVVSILNEAKFVDPSLGDLPLALKGRLTDSNKILITTTLNILTQLSECLGVHCRKHLPDLFANIIQCLSDSKPQVRQTALKCMDSWLANTNLSLWLEGEVISTALTNPKHTFLRIELLTWLTEKLLTANKLPKSAKEGLALCVPILFQCCEDRSGEVRAKAQTSLPAFIKHLTHAKLLRMTGKLSATSKPAIITMLDKANDQVPELPEQNKVSKQPPVATKPAPPVPKLAEEIVEKIVEEKITEKTAEITQKTAKPKKTASKLPQKSAAKKIEEEVESLFVNIPNGKMQRKTDDVKLKTMKWSFSAPREDLLQQLQQQIAPCVSPPLFSLLFHKDPQHHLKALAQITKALETEFEAVVSCLDVVFRWTTLRFYDKNTTVHIKTLEFVGTLFDALSAASCRVTDYEMSSFLPHLVVMIGANKPNIRSMVHSILKKSLFIFPYSKLFPYVMEGANSKNSRQRQECLLHLSALIRTNGIDLCKPAAKKNSPKVLKELASYIGDRDKEVRTTALDVIVAAYNVSGSAVLKQIGMLSEKDTSLLQERIKRTGKFVEVTKPEPTPKTADSQAVELTMTSSTPAMTSSSQVMTSSAIASSMEEREKIRKLRNKEMEEIAEVEITPFQQDTLDYYYKMIEQENFDKLVSNISEGDVTKCISSLEEILSKLDKPTEHYLFKGRVDNLVSCSAIKLKMAFDWYLPCVKSGESTQNNTMNISKPNFMLLVKHLVQLLNGVSSMGNLICEVTLSTLHNLLSSVITVMSNPGLGKLSFGPKLNDILSSIIGKLLKYCNSTIVFCAILKLLQQNEEISKKEYRSTVQKGLLAIIRSVIKQTKARKGNLENVKWPDILTEMDAFLSAYPSHHTMYADMTASINFVTDCISKLCAEYGKELINETGDLKNKADSPVMQIIKKELGIDFPSDEKPKEEIKENLSPEEIDKKLDSIFDKVSSQHHSKIGLNELYNFKKSHASATLDEKINARIDGYDMVRFSKYIREELLKVEQGTCLPVITEPTSISDYISNLNSMRLEYGLKEVNIEGLNNNNEDEPSSSKAASRQVAAPKDYVALRKKYNRILGREDC